MPTTPHTETDHVTEGQDQPEPAVNALVDDTQTSVHGTTIFDYSDTAGGPGDADYDVSSGADRATFLANFYIQLDDTDPDLTTGRNFIIPDVSKDFAVFNNTAQTITVKETSSTGVAVTTGTRKRLFYDGTEVRDF